MNRVVGELVRNLPLIKAKKIIKEHLKRELFLMREGGPLVLPSVWSILLEKHNYSIENALDYPENILQEFLEISLDFEIKKKGILEKNKRGGGEVVLFSEINIQSIKKSSFKIVEQY